MTRYKGRAKTKLVERDFPHHVDMMVPEFGFGTHLDAMYDWHHTRGVLALNGSGGRDENGRDIIVGALLIRQSRLLSPRSLARSQRRKISTKHFRQSDYRGNCFKHQIDQEERPHCAKP